MGRCLRRLRVLRRILRQLHDCRWNRQNNPCRHVHSGMSTPTRDDPRRAHAPAKRYSTLEAANSSIPGGSSAAPRASPASRKADRYAPHEASVGIRIPAPLRTSRSARARALSNQGSPRAPRALRRSRARPTPRVYRQALLLHLHSSHR